MSRMGLVAAFVIIAASACSGRQMLSLGDDGASLSLPPAEEIEATLDGNATTGFSWELVEYDAAVVLPVGEPSYVEVSSDVVGAGGQWTWILHAVDPGQTAVQFVYHRSWEDGPPESTFSFEVIVER